MGIGWSGWARTTTKPWSICWPTTTACCATSSAACSPIPRTRRTAWPRSAPSCGRGVTNMIGKKPAPPPGSPPCAATPPTTTSAPSTAADFRKNWTPASRPGPGPEEKVLQKERIQRLQEALDKLSARDRALFYRKYYYLQSTARIAAELGTTERAVEGKLYRIRKRLQTLLGGDAHEAG